MRMFCTLLVEDNASYRRTLRRELSELACSIVIEEASDGDEALRKIEAVRPDLVFMDIRLPDANGLDLTRRIKTQYPETRIAILTSEDDPQYRKAAHQHGADHFLAKNKVAPGEIVALVESIASRASFQGVT